MKKTFILKPKSYEELLISPSQNKEEILEHILASKIKFKFAKIKKPVILYGAGNLGKMTKEFFDYLKIRVQYVVDESTNTPIDPFWDKIKIVKPKDVSLKDKVSHTLVLCITTVPIVSFRKKLQKNGWKDVRFSYDTIQAYKNKHPLNNGWFVERFSLMDKKRIRENFSSFEDDLSKIHYLQFLAWRHLRLELVFKNIEVRNDNRFFIPPILEKIGQEEIFVDCGAHKGFVVSTFIKITGSKYKNIFCIEPDKKNLKYITKFLNHVPRSKIIRCALDRSNTKKAFTGGFDYASRIDNRSKELIKTKTLDSLKLKPTFLKMHLEGGELNALKGSMATIQKHRPLIAITIYHNSDGIYKTISFLIKNLSKYKFYLRMHTWAGTGVVIYGVPN